MDREIEQDDAGVKLHAAMDAWSDTVLRLATCRLRSRTDVEDVFQSVFLKLFERKEAFISKEHQKAWLLRVTINCCNDLHRSPWSKHVALEEISEPSTAFEEDSPCLDTLISHLPTKQRVAVHLHYFEGYSTDEIARITDEKPTTVRSHLRRARIALKLSIGGTDERIGISESVS